MTARRLCVLVTGVVLAGLAGWWWIDREPSLRVGVVANSVARGPGIGDQQDEVASLGAGWLREEFSWERIEPSPGRFEWAATDALMRESARRDLQVLPLLFRTPEWAGRARYEIPDDPARYAAFVARVVARYGPDGEFWEDEPDLDRDLAPRYFELWNEPYGEFYSAGDVDPARYARLVRAAARAGRAADPESRYLLAAETDVEVDGSFVDWVDALYAAVPDLGAYFDGVAVHPYSKAFGPDAPADGYVHDKVRRIDEIRASLSARGARDKPLWITELGWSTCPRATECVSERAQAAHLSRLFELLGTTYEDTVAAVFVYHLEDFPPGEGDDAEQWFGLRRTDGTRKPAWEAIREAFARTS